MATDFTYNNKTINSSGPIKPSGKNQPLDPRTEVKLYANIESIPSPYIGMTITVLADETNSGKMTDYKVISLKADNLGVANSVVDQVQRYIDYLGASSGGSVSQEDINTAVNNYLTEHPVQSGATAEQAAQIEDNKIAITDIINNKLDGKSFKFLTQAEYEALSEEEKNNNEIEYHITDSVDIKVPEFGSSDVGKVLLVNNDGISIGWGSLTAEGLNIRDINNGEEFTIIGQIETVYGNIVLNKTNITINEDSSDTFTVSLDKAPTNNQTVSLSLNNANCTLSETSLNFTSDNFSDPQTITVNGVHDTNSYADKSSVITVKSSGVPNKTIIVSITNIDEEQTIGLNSISIDEVATVKVGSAITLTATLDPANATNKTVTWGIDNSNCTINPNGLSCTVSGVATGSSIVTVTSEDGNYSDSCNITIEENNISETDLIEGAKLSLRGKQQSGTVLNDESGNGYNASIERGTWVDNYISSPKICISNETYPDMFTDNYFTYTIVVLFGDVAGMQYLTRVTNKGTNTVYCTVNYIEMLNITLNCAGTWITTGDMKVVVDTKYVITIVRKQKDESNDVFEFYINNELKYSADISNTKLILKDSDFIVDSSSENSRLYDIVYYDKALTPTELTHNYNALMGV